MTIELLVNIDVDDLDRAIAFYGDAFGFRVGRRFGRFGVELLGGSSAIYLLAKPEGSAPAETTTERRRYGRHWTPVHLDVVVPDLDAALTRAEAAGADVEGKVRTHVWGRLVQLSDPFGHGVCLVEFLGRGYDEIADPPART
jgi:lactoylglutathione lyase